ncbi:MAG: transcription termination/antitermination factor NusG [Elusimicrobiales bacterium]|jgi:transcriptional antiterminator NusG|nr:transcription termination/antitermination factor NusG [Elusimicrobiales bacterium]
MPGQWYIIQTRTGFEESVLKNIQARIDNHEFDGKVFQVLIPVEDVIQVKNNTKKITKRKFFPGYVLINMEMDNLIHQTIKGINGVSGFLGDPDPKQMEESEVEQIFELMNSSSPERPKAAVQFEKGEQVRITEGPFKYFVGKVDDVSEQKSKVRVIVTVFDRPTTMELDLLQVEKI